MGNNTTRSSSRSSKALAPSIPMPPLADAMDDQSHLSVDRFCLLAGPRGLGRDDGGGRGRPCAGLDIARSWATVEGHRWGRTHSEIGYHGGKVKVEPGHGFVTSRVGQRGELGELAGCYVDGNLNCSQAWALNLMVLNVSTRKYAPRGPSAGRCGRRSGESGVG